MLGAGLTTEDIQDHKRRLDASVQVRVLELAAEEMQDDCFGFRLARDFELGEIGLLYYVMASSERLADALRNAERYCAINNEGVRLRLSLEPTFTIGLEYLNIDRLSDHLTVNVAKMPGRPRLGLKLVHPRARNAAISFKYFSNMAIRLFVDSAMTLKNSKGDLTVASL